MKAKDFRAQAREALHGNWWIAVAVTLVASILGVFGTGGSGGRAAEEYGDKIPGMNEFLATPAGRKVLFILGVIAAFAAIWALLKFVIGGALTLGYRTYTMNLVDRRCPMFSDLFSKFDMFAKGFVMQLLMGIYIVLWSMLFLVPGIVKAYAYSMTSYILAEHPEMSANEAITASRELMRGNKWRLFCLQLSFIGWDFLNLFTVGFGTLWLRPYKMTAEAAFYRQLCAEKA